jgi:GTP-binding protein HflX
MSNEVNETAKLAAIASVHLANVTDLEFNASLVELRELAKTLGYRVIETFTQNRTSFDTNGYLGIGKRQEIRQFVRGRRDEADDEIEIEDADARTIDEVTQPAIEMLFVDHEISPSQARNLEKEIGCEVMDRTMLILEIFQRNARTRIAVAQVEMARLGYMAPRLREAAKAAGPQGRQRSGVGGRGAGESHTELDRRKIRDRIAALQAEIAAMHVERDTQRARRQGNQSPGTVALVGYTNAGKSTLMRALTGSQVLVANKLFATLDTTVRALHPESVPRVLVTDTVGFIKNLPHGLVESFKSTLEEALDASLLLHVIDCGDPGFERQLEVTEDVLRDIRADNVARIKIFNKIDHVGDADQQAEHEAALKTKYPDCVVMSAVRPQDVARLHAIIVDHFQRDLIEGELFVPWNQQQLRGEIFSRCQVVSERAEEDGAFFLVRAEPATLEQLHEQLNPTSEHAREEWERDS